MNRYMLRILAGACVLALSGALAAGGASSHPDGDQLAVAGQQQAHRRPSGLTAQSIKIAHEAGMSNRYVTMTRQSNPHLLSRATVIGPHAQHSTIKLTVALKLRNQAKLKSFLEQVQNPHSAVYHQWLTPKQAVARFGPSKAQVAAVTQWLRSRGIKVLDVTPNNILVHTKATTEVYEHALGIRINDYKLNGRSFYSTSDRPKLPRSMAAHVLAINGLRNAAVMRPHSHFRKQSKGVTQAQAPASSTYTFYPRQLAKVYDVPSVENPTNGAGVTIAILTAMASGLQAQGDYRTFWDQLGLPDHDVTIIPIDGDSGNTDGMLETLLDMEYSGGTSPGVKLVVYVADDPEFTTFDDMYSQFQMDNTAGVMTTSWGAPEGSGDNATDEAIFALAATQGISMFAAAGDLGAGDGTGTDNACDYPSASLYITAAGGTTLRINDDWTRESERASSSTGGAECTLPAPYWQHGPGVPENGVRETSDMSANYGDFTPYYVYVSSGWATAMGTSAVAPVLSGIFADAVARNGDRLGQSNKLIYEDVMSGNYATDFYDVTEGSNGYPAGPDWDHPTGFGTPNATNLINHLGIQGPKGTLTGTVTAAANAGSAIGGALVVAAVPGSSTTYATWSASAGTYSRMLPAGDYDVTVSHIGYENGHATVSISNSETTTRDFALQPVPKVTLSGRVTDGSGHGYALYADVKVSVEGGGQVADVWTNPATGKYSVELPEGSTYTVNVAAVLDGYNTASATVALSANTTKNFPLTVASACTAPGYAFTGGLHEDFNGTSFPPAGWTVTNAVSDSPVVWLPNTGWGDGNWTGGTGLAADSNSNTPGLIAPFYRGPHDTSLITPPIPVSALGGVSTLAYKANFLAFGGGESLDLDISTDGGTNWITIKHWVSQHGGYSSLPGVDVNVDLAPYLPQSGTFQLRWHNHDYTSDGFDPVGWDYYAQIDDVVVGNPTCAPLVGGLIEGRVTNSLLGDAPAAGATLTADSGENTRAFSNPNDPGADGTYIFFVPAGRHALTATDGRLSPATQSVNVADNALVSNVDFSLRGTTFAADPGSFVMNVKINSSATARFSVSNTGNGKGAFNVVEFNAPAPSTLPNLARAVSAPLHLLYGHYGTGALPSIERHGREFSRGTEMTSRALAKPAANAAWTAIANYPIPVMDSCAASLDGKVYSFTGRSTVIFAINDYVFDPANGTWSPIADFPAALGKPVCAAVGNKIYITGGSFGVGTAVNKKLYIYDPASNSFTTGADYPGAAVGAGFAAAGVALDGSFYVIGGCDSQCTVLSSKVYAYHPGSNNWSMVQDYPTKIAWQGCGAADSVIYCGGGMVSSKADTTAAYEYNPKFNDWTPIANLLYDNWGMTAIGANGKLLLQDGVTDGTATATNQGQIYDPGTNSWSKLPNNIVTTYRAAGACGFHMIGGMDPTDSLPNGIGRSEVLPGFDMCPAQQSPSNIPWLTVSPATSTLASGASAHITVTFDGSGQKEFTSSQAYLRIEGGLNNNAIVPITVHWEPPVVDLNVVGSVSPTGIVKKGDALAYSITVQNLAGAEGVATQVRLTYEVPDGVNFLASNGAQCAVPAGSSAGAVPAVVAGPMEVVCDLGSLAPDADRLVNLSVQATTDADAVTGTFSATAREPDNDSSNNSLTLSTNPSVGPPGPPGTAGQPGPAGPTGPQGSKGDSGSGGFGWLVLAALLGFVLVGGYGRYRRRLSD